MDKFDDSYYLIKFTFARLEVKRQYFKVRVIENWNKLPYKVRSAKSGRQFRTAVRGDTMRNRGRHRHQTTEGSTEMPATILPVSSPWP